MLFSRALPPTHCQASATAAVTTQGAAPPRARAEAGLKLPMSCAGAEKAAQGADAVGEYLAALSLAASNSSADAPALVKRLNSSVLDPALSAGTCAAGSQLLTEGDGPCCSVRDCLR